MDTNRFTQKSLEALQAAQQLAQSYGNAQVEQVHLLNALLSQENGLIGQLMGKLGLNVQQVRTACESAVNRLPKISGSNQQPYVTASLSQALTEAENQMKQMRDEYISVEHLFLGLLEKRTARFARCLPRWISPSRNFWRRCRPFAAVRA